MLAVAARHKAITGNPLRETSPIPVARKEVRALSPAEVRTLRRKLREWQDAPMPNGRYSRADDLLDVVDVLLATGCRIPEALAPRWEDVDLDALRVTITGAVVSLKGRAMGRQDHPKSRGSMLAYTVDQDIAGRLWARWERSMTLGIVGAMVFPSATGTLRDPSSFRAQWRTAAAAIGFDWVTPHTLRRPVATRLADAEGLAAASAYLGHSNEAVTVGHYRAKAREAADRTAALADFWYEGEDTAP